jgi:hypothetical protein
VQLSKADDVSDWSFLRSDPDSLFVRRMYKYVGVSFTFARVQPADEASDFCFAPETAAPSLRISRLLSAL